MMRSSRRRAAWSALLALGCGGAPAGAPATSTAADLGPPAPAVAEAAPAGSLLSLLEDGDVLLHRSMSAQSAALQAATGSPFTHVGLAFRREGGVQVLEAVQPVRWTPLEDWVRRGRDGTVVVLRLADVGPIAGAGAARLRSAGERFLGRPYDALFEWSDEKIYCSELVFKAYREAVGLEIGELRPMGAFDLSSPEVRRLIQARAAGRINLEEPVVAPSSLLTDDDLVIVYSDDPEVRASASGARAPERAR
jgi:hypothetical protein